MADRDDRETLYESDDGHLFRGAFIDTLRVQAPWVRNRMPHWCKDPGWRRPRKSVGRASARLFSSTNPQGRRSLCVEASLPKVAQGHNLFCPFDLDLQIPKLLFATQEALPGEESGTAAEWEAWLEGDYFLNRMDVTGMFFLGSQKKVRSALRALALCRHWDLGAAWRSRTSVYFGRRGGEHILKFYDKEAELRAAGHELPRDLPLKEELLAYAHGMLRVEVQFKRDALNKRHLRRVQAWSPLLPGRLLREDLAKLYLPACHTLTEEEILSLPAQVQETARRYAAGKECRGLLSRATFYRHRGLLLPLGIDINVCFEEERAEQTIKAQKQLDMLLQQPFAGVPAWALGTAVCDEVGVLSF